MDKKYLTETDIITKFILPAIEQVGWDSMTQLRQEVKLCDGKVIVRGNMLDCCSSLEEQHRIITKVDELITLCDTLKTNLQNAQTTQLPPTYTLVEQAVG